MTPSPNPAQSQPAQTTRQAHHTKVDRAFTLISTAVVAASAIAGFWLIGSPNKQRLIGLDRERVGDLYSIAVEVLSQTNASPSDEERSLPDDLSGLRALGYLDLTDPVTDTEYEYTRLDDQRYQLCADFDTDSSEDAIARADEEDFWDHSAGNHCYEFSTEETVPRLSRRY